MPSPPAPLPNVAVDADSSKQGEDGGQSHHVEELQEAELLCKDTVGTFQSSLQGVKSRSALQDLEGVQDNFWFLHNILPLRSKSRTD